jgi:hypothetical protein
MEHRFEMQFHEIARGSAEEARLLDSAAARHGAWIHRAAALLERWFLLGSEWAPGLRFVGGETSPDFAHRLGLPARSMSVGAAAPTLSTRSRPVSAKPRNAQRNSSGPAM